MLVWLRHLPRDAATVRAQNPDIDWGLSEQLLAAIFDGLQWGNWQRQGNSKAPKPAPLSRPGVADKRRRYGKTDLPPERVKEILDAYSRGDYDTEGGDDGG